MKKLIYLDNAATTKTVQKKRQIPGSCCEKKE